MLHGIAQLRIGSVDGRGDWVKLRLLFAVCGSCVVVVVELLLSLLPEIESAAAVVGAGAGDLVRGCEGGGGVEEADGEEVDEDD